MGHVCKHWQELASTHHPCNGKLMLFDATVTPTMKNTNPRVKKSRDRALNRLRTKSYASTPDQRTDGHGRSYTGNQRLPAEKAVIADKEGNPNVKKTTKTTTCTRKTTERDQTARTTISRMTTRHRTKNQHGRRVHESSNTCVMTITRRRYPNQIYPQPPAPFFFDKKIRFATRPHGCFSLVAQESVPLLFEWHPFRRTTHQTRVVLLFFEPSYLDRDPATLVRRARCFLTDSTQCECPHHTLLTRLAVS